MAYQETAIYVTSRPQIRIYFGKKNAHKPNYLGKKVTSEFDFDRRISHWSHQYFPLFYELLSTKEVRPNFGLTRFAVDETAYDDKMSTSPKYCESGKPKFALDTKIKPLCEASSEYGFQNYELITYKLSVQNGAFAF